MFAENMGLEESSHSYSGAPAPLFESFRKERLSNVIEYLSNYGAADSKFGVPLENYCGCLFLSTA